MIHFGKLLSKSPINRWPSIKASRQKRFEWKSDIVEMITSQEFKDDKERNQFVKEMKARMVLIAEDMKKLIPTEPVKYA